MKVLFFGSSNYCLPILDSLITNFKLISVVTKKNQAVEKFAQSHNIKTFTPANKEELLNLKNEISCLKPDLAIVADYGLLIPIEIFSIPRYRTLNIHFSLLPKLRGPAPVQYTILLGEEKAGISVIIMDEDLDTGDIVWQKEILTFNSQHLTVNKETSDSLYKKLFNIAASELPDVISKYVKNELKPQKQIHTVTTYTKHFTRDDGFIPAKLLDKAMNGVNPSENELNNLVISKILPIQLCTLNFALCTERALRALSPWPGLWTEINLTFNNQHLTKRLKILKVHLEPTTKLVIDLVQLEGKKPVTWKQFLQGYPNSIFTNNKI